MITLQDHLSAKLSAKGTNAADVIFYVMSNFIVSFRLNQVHFFFSFLSLVFVCLSTMVKNNSCMMKDFEVNYILRYCLA